MLAGIVVSNAIVLLDAIRQLREAAREEALLLPGRRRVRPIVITSVTTVIGLFPLAFTFWGRGRPARDGAAVIRRSDRLDLYTLSVIPCLYMIWWKGWREKPPLKRPRA